MKQSSFNTLMIQQRFCRILIRLVLFLISLTVFKKLSGLVINSSKTEGMWIGSSRGKTLKPFGIKWPDEPIKALGVYYSYDIKLLHEKNFIRHDNVIDLIMKITGRIIFKTTFRCPHDTIIRSKYNIQQITRALMFKFKFLVPRG